MSSTYSTLAIQLMGTGDNATTWGNVTNVNLGTAMEEAIVGTIDVPFTTADVTLTLTNTNATQSARNLRLNLTGTPASAFNLIIPAVAGSASAAFEKPYIINNTTGQTITVKHATGTGIAVPTGKTMWVYANGTNVVDVATHLTSLTLASALPVASGGTGVTASTGTVAVVLSTSPTLVTPLLGTPTSGVLTNCTGLPLATGVTGTLAVANGGTGQTTYTNGQLLIGNTTGNTLTKATLTAGTNVTITNGSGAITIDATDAFVGTVTSVGGTGTVNGLTLTGTVTSTGNLTLGGTLSGVSLSTQVTGTLPVANGGTGQTTYTDGQLLIGNTTGNTLTKTTLTAGTNVTITNGAGAITINAADQYVGTVTSVGGTGTVNGLTLTGTVTSTGDLTLGGTLSGVSLTTQVSGTLPIANGGTNATSAAAALTSLGAYPAANPSGYTSNTGTVTSVGGTGTVNGLTLTGTVTSTGDLTLGGTLSGVSLTTQVSGTLPVANGGTGGTTQATARSGIGAAVSGANTDITSLSPTGSLTLNPTTGTIVGAPTGGVQGAGTINATGLFVNGVAVGVGSGSVSSVAMSVPAFLSVAGSPITTLGTLAVTLSGTALPTANGGTGSTSTTYCSLTANVTGTLPVANGGTGQTTYTNGQLLIGNTTGNTLTKATLTAGTGIAITNGTGSITIAATGGTGTVTSTSVVSANGFAGTVATASTTPAITITTSITGILKGNGTAISAATAGTDYVAPGGALGTPSSGTLTNCTFPTLNQSTTGSAATLTTARTFTIGATGKTFNGSANVSWTLVEIGAAASGANSDITSLTALTSIPTATTINGVTVGYRSIPRSTTTTTAAVGDVGKCIAVTANIAIPNSTFAAGDAVSIYNDSASAITITAGVTTLRLAGTTTTGNRTLDARGMATVWFNSSTEAIISGAGVS